jgi:hypothetical protein
MRAKRPTSSIGPAQARIIVGGRLSDRLAGAFEGMTPVRHPGRTELVGEIADQAHLYGLLARIRDLGLELQHVTVTAAERAGATRTRGNDSAFERVDRGHRSP